MSFFDSVAPTILEKLPEALLIITDQGELVYVNDAVENLTGFSADELDGEHVSILLPSSAQRRLDVVRWLGRWAENPDPSQLRYLNLDGITKSGDEKRYRVRVSAFSEGGQSYFLVVIRDITEELEESRRLQHERLVSDRILAIGEDGILTIDSNQRIQFWNKKAEQIFGYSEEEILGEPIELLIPEDSGESHADHVRNFAGGDKPSKLMGQRSEIQGRHKNGDAIPLEISITKTQIENSMLLSAQIRDISDRKAAERALRESELRFRVLFENAFEAMVLMTVDGLVLEINNAALDLLPAGTRTPGQDKDQSNFWDLNWWGSASNADIESNRQQLKKDVASACAGETIRSRGELHGEHGSRDIDFSLIPLKGEDGTPLFILAEGRDLTALDESR